MAFMYSSVVVVMTFEPQWPYWPSPHQLREKLDEKETYHLGCKASKT
jgi:hypothetical protein